MFRQQPVRIFSTSAETAKGTIIGGSEGGALSIRRISVYHVSSVGAVPEHSFPLTALGVAPSDRARPVTACFTRCNPRMAGFELRPWRPRVSARKRVIFTPEQKIRTSPPEVSSGLSTT